MRRKQLLLESFERSIASYGGETVRGKRKTARPISTRKPIHVVMRSSLATGVCSLRAPGNRKFIEAELSSISKRHGLKIYAHAVVGNHLHLLVRAFNRTSLKNFLRHFAGKVARKITGAKKGNALGRRFWDELAFSRIVEWGKAFRTALKYVRQNAMEAAGVIAYRRNGLAKKKARELST